MNQSTPREQAVDNRDFVEVGLGAILRDDPDVRTMVGAVRRLLITRRAAGSVMSGYWELPGGKIEPGETPTACVGRELREELGVEVVLTEQLAPIEHSYDHARVRLHACIGTLAPGSPEAANLEVAEHRWVTADELAGFRFLPANAGILEEVVERMRG
ncbi:MAG: (deoxy)nucleoside triphosphate pyrophosphohydrolase [Phycisphaeraceae bacterium]|nr:(deoxy)nucleoside triphosphate pyrophosphohydrolase [Phycisphaeraceae bacterium]MCB9848024.1 (deoxy)nucleoside triphosphate pyrophosphohydrolase [Phycisphaeraceae bacterium]